MNSYKRILLKLSGEALASDKETIEPNILNKIIKIIKSLRDENIEVAIVIGGGNIFRGEKLQQVGVDPITSDHMGMLATVINALAIFDACNKNKINAVVMSGFEIGGGVCDAFNHNKAKQHLNNGTVVILAAGTGNPCFTTDTGAVLRAIEINADIIFKATKVDGVYTDDPIKNSAAKRYTSLTFDEAINKNLQVMDTSAFALCRQHNMKICIFSMLEDGNTLLSILKGKKLGTIISN